MIKRAFAWLRDVIVALYIAPLKEPLSMSVSSHSD